MNIKNKMEREKIMGMIDKKLDVRNLQSPQPMLHALRAMDKLNAGQILMVTTTESASVNNIQAMCDQTGHNLMQIIDWDNEYTFMIRCAA